MPKATHVDPNAVVFGAIVKRLRTERGWSIVQLADAVGMNATHVGVLERGGNTPSLSNILIFGKAFGVEAAELVREVERAFNKSIEQRAAREAKVSS